MRQLLRVELTRLLWRRAVLLLLAASVVIPVVIGVATVWNTQPPSAADKQRIDTLVAEQRESPQVQRDLAQCIEEPNDWGVDPDTDDVRAQCEEFILPQPEWFADYRELDLAEEREQGSGFGVVVIVTLLMVLAGTTFAGNDWNSGSMSNQLLFEPRRGRVWAAKGLVVLVGAFAVSAVVFTAYWLALSAVARARDLPAGNALVLDCLQQGWRGALVAGCAALGGYALTMLFRSTVATLGVLFAVAVAGGMLVAALGIGERWQPQVNLTAVVLDGTTYYVEVPQECFGMQPPDDPSLCDDERELSLEQGGGYLGVLLVLGLVPSALSFRRRDVP
jgi:ABC-2 type transport system permease protein